MIKVILLLTMLFCHIVDDYYLQGILANLKQKQWWKKNAPDMMYRNDYVVALIEHAFSWTFAVHFPIFLYYYLFKIEINPWGLLVLFPLNWIIHAIIDHAKANVHTINLIEDQIFHTLQVLVIWAVGVFAV